MLKYECHLENGSIVDSSDVYENKPEMRGEDGVGIKIKAGTGAVIDGWD